jgi:hypothetical protein
MITPFPHNACTDLSPCGPVCPLCHPCPAPVGDLVGLVEAAARHPPTCHQLREVLNMGRNADKWAAFCRGLQDRVSRGAVVVGGVPCSAVWAANAAVLEQLLPAAV